MRLQITSICIGVFISCHAHQSQASSGNQSLSLKPKDQLGGERNTNRTGSRNASSPIPESTPRSNNDVYERCESGWTEWYGSYCFRVTDTITLGSELSETCRAMRNSSPLEVIDWHYNFGVMNFMRDNFLRHAWIKRGKFESIYTSQSFMEHIWCFFGGCRCTVLQSTDGRWMLQPCVIFYYGLCQYPINQKVHKYPYHSN